MQYISSLPNFLLALPRKVYLRVLSVWQTPSPVLWVLFAVVILLVDFYSGPHWQFPLFFVLPVALAAWQGSLAWSLGMAAVLPVVRLIMHSFLWVDDTDWFTLFGNCFLRWFVLTLMGFLVWKVNRQLREIKILRGILSICMYCKRVRTPDEHWIRVEEYISHESDLRFSHGICPDCMREHHQELT